MIDFVTLPKFILVAQLQGLQLATNDSLLQQRMYYISLLILFEFSSFLELVCIDLTYLGGGCWSGALRS